MYRSDEIQNESRNESRNDFGGQENIGGLPMNQRITAMSKSTASLNPQTASIRQRTKLNDYQKSPIFEKRKYTASRNEDSLNFSTQSKKKLMSHEKTNLQCAMNQGIQNDIL